METRLIIAYLLIALLAAMVALFARHIALKRREHRRLMRGRGAHNRHSGRRWPTSEAP
jgi:hypothetical protein